MSPLIMADREQSAVGREGDIRRLGPRGDGCTRRAAGKVPEHDALVGVTPRRGSCHRGRRRSACQSPVVPGGSRGFHVPGSQSVIAPCPRALCHRCERLAVGREHHAMTGAGCGQRERQLPAREVPELDRSVPLDVTSVLPSGENATAQALVCPLRGWPSRHAGLEVPDLRAILDAARGQPLAVGRERAAGDLARVLPRAVVSLPVATSQSRTVRPCPRWPASGRRASRPRTAIALVGLQHHASAGRRSGSPAQSLSCLS